MTDRIRLVTDAMLGRLRQNPAMIAKQILSLDALAGGGRTVSVSALGGRDDDYAVAASTCPPDGEWLDDRPAEDPRDLRTAAASSRPKVGPRPKR